LWKPARRGRQGKKQTRWSKKLGERKKTEEWKEPLIKMGR